MAEESAPTKRARGASPPPAESTSIIIVPYRATPGQHRDDQLRHFIQHFADVAPNLHILVVEQSDDGKFNRGQLLNAGFQLATEQMPRADTFIFHDVDLLPSADLIPAYTTPPRDGPLHIARVWGRYSKNINYFGGVVAFTAEQFRAVNGFPNNFWGWGGEDDELRLRVRAVRLRPTAPSQGTLTDLEGLTLEDKLTLLRANPHWKCMTKRELLAEHARTWRTNGLSNLVVQVVGRRSLSDHDTTR